MSQPHKFSWDDARRLHASGWTIPELAHRFSVTKPAIYHAVRDIVELRPKDSRHGTMNAYSNLRCRCERCRRANTDAMRAYRAGRRAA